MARPGQPGRRRHGAARAAASSAARRSACWSRSTRSAATPASATKTSRCCSPSPPARRPRSPPPSRSPRTAPAKASPRPSASAAAGRASCTTSRCRASPACGCCSPPPGAAIPRKLDRLLVQGIEQVDDAIAEMRRLIADLRPSTLDELGLGAALEALGERTSASGAIEVEIDLDLDFEAGRTKHRLARRDRGHRLPAGPGGAQQRGPARRRPSAPAVEVTRGRARRCGCGSHDDGQRLRPQRQRPTASA